MVQQPKVWIPKYVRKYGPIGKPLRMQGYEDAVFHARLGRLMEGRDHWWPWGEDEAESAKAVNAISEIAVAYGEAFFTTLADPGHLPNLAQRSPGDTAERAHSEPARCFDLPETAEAAAINGDLFGLLSRGRQRNQPQRRLAHIHR